MSVEFKGADTTPTPTQNDLMVAMHMVYRLFWFLQNYFAMQMNKVLYEDYTGSF